MATDPLHFPETDLKRVAKPEWLRKGHPLKSRTVNCHNDDLLRAKMIAGILTLSMISNGIYNRETTELQARKTLRLEAEQPQRIKGYLPKKPFVNSSLLTLR